MEHIYIHISRGNRSDTYDFTFSASGTLDFAGKVKKANISDCEKLESSPYFSPAQYTYLPPALKANIEIFYKDPSPFEDANLFAYITHIGPVLLAVEENDGLLVAELLNRRRKTFFPFLPLTIHIVKPIAPLALFAWIHGRFFNDEEFLQMYASGRHHPQSDSVAELLLAAAEKELKPNPESETPNQMFIRYFESHPNSNFTIGIVGSHFHGWSDDIDNFDLHLKNSIEKDFIEGMNAVQRKKSQFFSNLSVSVQAEPYNSHDPNAIGVSIENVSAKFFGNGGKSKTGYLRATGAFILRKSFPQKFSYKASLARLKKDADEYGGVSKIVLRIQC